MMSELGELAIDQAVIEMTYDEFIIEAVRARPFLYNIKDVDYKDSIKKDNAWEEIGQMLQWTPQETKKVWESKRDSFLRFRRSKVSSKSGQGAKSNTRPWPFYDQMLWYLDFAHQQTSAISNLKRPFLSCNGSQTNGPAIKLESSAVPITPAASGPVVRGESLEQPTDPTPEAPHEPPKKRPRIVPPPDIKKRNSDEITSSLLQEASGMTAAVKMMAGSRNAETSGDPSVDAFKMVAGIEFSKVSSDQRSACQIAVLQLICTFQ